ncbi:Uncharacterised protein [Streptococcus pneumoniae]|nr:Uncharacterised protein [Streptococcus pneumoniae]
MSALALLEEYGLFGANGVFSVNFPVFPKEPYTSSVDTCTSFICEYFLTSSNKVTVPITFVS